MLHGDEVCSSLPTEVVHAADIPVRYLPGEFQFVAEALFCPLDGGNLGLYDLDGDFFVNLHIESLIDTAHAAPAQLPLTILYRSAKVGPVVSSSTRVCKVFV